VALFDEGTIRNIDRNCRSRGRLPSFFLMSRLGSQKETTSATLSVGNGVGLEGGGGEEKLQAK
jgi:hypothetical protein